MPWFYSEGDYLENTKMQLEDLGLGHILYQTDLTEEGFLNKMIVLTEDWKLSPQLGEPEGRTNRDSDI